MKTLLILVVSTSLWGQTGATIHATAQCESVDSNVLGIKSLKTCDIGVTNYGSTPVMISEAMIREWFPTLDIENAARAQAVGDKAFGNSKKSKAIAVLNFLSPLAVAFMGGGVIHASIGTVAAISLANTAAQSFKSYLIGQQPNEASFLPNLPMSFTLSAYGSSGFSVVYTVLGSINFTNSPVVTPGGARKFGAPKPNGGTLIWNGTLPTVPVRVGMLEHPNPVTGADVKTPDSSRSNQMTCDYDPATGRVYDCSPQSELIRSQTVVAAWSVSPKPPSFEVLATTPAHF